MRKAALLTLFTVAIALPVLADEEERHQSWLSYEDGGTVVRSGENGEEIAAHRNLPVYPGDEVITARRGRAEVRLSDGNIIGVDRATSLRFRSILDSYEGEGNETVAELKYGKVAVHRTDIGRDHVRLDTDNASYVAEREALYTVETDARGRDRVTVFDGTIEVRTPTRSTRLREGDSASVDDRGAYDLIGDQRSSADEFERWFLDRAERFGSYNSRYLDRRQAYWNDDLDDHGRWVFVTGIGWSWRPYVAVGWRPYYNGYWYSRNNCLTWVSYDPWGWGPYHYGRWAYDPGFGWVWVPGYGYSPAWVYWTFGSGFVGWAPSGWWDCHRPYYNWAYQPYSRYSARLGFGFYGRVRLNELDLRPWTFIDSRNVISNRVDRAALTADAVKQRLGRNRDGYVTVAGGANRMTREDWNDPAEAVRRRSVSDRMGRNTGAESGAPPTDLTPFFRRDGEVSGPVRDRIARGSGRGGSSSGSGGGYASGVPSSRDTVSRGGSVAPIGSGNVAPIGSGNVAPVGRGSVAPVDSGRRGGETPSDNSPNWRDRNGNVDRGGSVDRGNAPATGSGSGTSRGSSDSWRNRVSRSRSGSGGSSSSDTTSTPPPTTSGSGTSTGSSDVPRRVIDRIGGARVYPRDSGRGSGGSSASSGRSSSRDSGGSSSRGSSSGGSVNRGDRGSSGGGSVHRGSSGGSSSGSSGSSSRSSGSSSSGSSSRSEGRSSGSESVKRD